MPAPRLLNPKKTPLLVWSICKENDMRKQVLLCLSLVSVKLVSYQCCSGKGGCGASAVEYMVGHLEVENV
jgi:hypothetical protein